MFVIGFIIIYIIGSEIIFQCQVAVEQGKNPYPYGSTLFSFIYYIIILVLSIWLTGWIMGIILFLLSMLSFVHASAGWLLT